MKGGWHLSNPPEWNCCVISIAFYFLIGAFQIIQAYATTYSSFFGSMSSGFAYMVYAISTPLAPLFIKKIDYKYSFLASFTAYSIYIFSFWIGNGIFIICSGVLRGMFSPIKWTSQTAFITQCCNVYEYQNSLPYCSQIGTFQSVFSTFYSFHLVCAFLFAALYFQYDPKSSIKTLFLICAVTAFASCLLVLLIRKMPESALVQDELDREDDMTDQNIESNALLNASIDDGDEENADMTNENEEENDGRKWEHLQNVMFNGWGDSRLYCILGWGIWRGMVIEFTVGEFPTLIDNTADKFYVMCCLGVAAMGSTFLAGKLVDVFDASVFIMFVTMFGNVTVFSLIIYYEMYGFDAFSIDELSMWFIIGCIFGFCGKPLVQMQASTIFAKLFGNQPDMYAKLIFCSSMTSSIAYFYHSYLSMITKAGIAMSVCVLATMLLFVNEHNRRNFRLNCVSLWKRILKSFT